MKTLLERLQEINAANRAWMEEDPKNRWAGCLTENLDHWKDYGICTAEGLDEYLDACVAREVQKNQLADY